MQLLALPACGTGSPGLQAFAVCFVAPENTNWPSFYQ